MKSLTQKLDRIVPSASMAMAQKASEQKGTRKIIDLSWGQPDFDTPQHIKLAAWEAIQAGRTGYTSSYGVPELRQEICAFEKDLYGAAYNSLTEVLVTPGVKQGLMYTLAALTNPGDEVVIFEPCWLSYRDMIYLNEGVPRFVPSENDLSPDLGQLERSITKKTKALLINNPVNPTGYIFSKDELKEIIRLAIKHDLYVIADEIYDRLAFDGFDSLAQFDGIKERLIIANGFSKSYAMTGWRIGYLLGPAPVISKIGLIHQHTATCASSIGQYAALAALKGEQSFVEDMRRVYSSRSEFMSNALKRTRFPMLRSQGTFYAMMDVSSLGVESGKSAEWLLDQCGIATVDGSAYGASSRDYVRLSLTHPMNILQEAVKRLEKG